MRRMLETLTAFLPTWYVVLAMTLYVAYILALCAGIYTVFHFVQKYW